MTWRMLGDLIDRLPPESATKTAIRDEIGAEELAEMAARPAADDGGPTKLGAFSQADMHTAALIDEIRWLRYAVYHAQGGKPSKPAQYPRPGVAPVKARSLTPRQRNYLADIRASRPQRAMPAVPAHIEATAAKKLGPAERAWILQQIHR